MRACNFREGHSIVVGMSNYFRLPNADFYAVNGVSAAWMLSNPYFKLERTEKDETGKTINVEGTLAEVLEEKAEMVGTLILLFK